MLTIRELAERWMRANQPRQNRRTGQWIGWSPKTAKTHGDNLRTYILPKLGNDDVAAITGLDLDDLYSALDDGGLSPSVVARCHGQIRAMYSWALRKKLVAANPALSAGLPRSSPGSSASPRWTTCGRCKRRRRRRFPHSSSLLLPLARRSTLVALRWGDVDLGAGTATFSRSIAESDDGDVEKGTKADRPYVTSLGPSTVSVLTADRRRAAEQAMSIGIAIGPGSFVFSDDCGLTPWSLSWPSHAWRRFSAKAGITPTPINDLRHTAASQMLMAGIRSRSSLNGSGFTEANVLRAYRHFIPGSDRGPPS